MATVAPKELGLMEQLTPFERRFVMKQRAMEILSSFAFPFRALSFHFPPPRCCRPSFSDAQSPR